MPSQPTVCYDLRFPSHGQNLVEVEVLVPQAAGQQAKTHAGQDGAFFVDVMMPVWTPGSYLVREFAKHVQDFRAASTQEAPLSARKINKHTWRITAAEPTDITLHYRVWGRELTVRSNCIEQDFAVLQGAATYLSPTRAHGYPHRVRMHLPRAYETAVCGLELSRHDDVMEFVAADFDELVDSPVALGRPDLQHFTLDGVPHTLATFGGEGLFDGLRASQDFAKIARCTQQLFGHIPYRRYVMINLLYGGQGGLEHRHSAVIMAGPHVMRDTPSYHGFLGLVAHEHFHAWNIKRLRPKALGPFDYAEENYTPSLWVAEGITAFYDNLMVLRAGFGDAKSYLSALNGDWARLMATRGRHCQSLGEASFDAWIKFYRRDENTDNTAVSYYLKGSIVAMLLNGALLLHSHNEVCLDDVMRLAYSRYSQTVGFDEAQFRACATELCPGLPESFFIDAVDTPKELDLDTVCRAFGLGPTPPPTAEGHHDQDKDGMAKVKLELGVTLKEADGRLMVASVIAGGPASNASLQADDELVAINNWRLNSAVLGHMLTMCPPGKPLTVLLSRYGSLRTVQVQAQQAAAKPQPLRWLSGATAEQRRARALWLGEAAALGMTMAPAKE